MNWKTQAAAAIVTTQAPAPSVNPDVELALQLQAALNKEAIAPSSVGFAQSVLNGLQKYGSFTERQREAVQSLIARAAQAPVESPDKALGEALNAALEAGLIGWKDLSFASSLQSGFKRYGSFTDRQRPHVERLVARATENAQGEGKTLPATLVAAPLPVAAPAKPATLCPNICATVSLERFSRFTVGELQLSLKNDGSVIWVKYAGQIAGSIDPLTTAYRETKRYLSADALARCLDALVCVEADPLEAAKGNGVMTGRCSCCGRPLTDPVSIKIGVGPICLARF